MGSDEMKWIKSGSGLLLSASSQHFFFFFYSRGLRPENVYKAIGILGSWVVEESFLLGLKRAASMSLEVLVGNQSTSCNQARKEKKMKNVSSRHILLLYLGTHKKAPSASRPSTVFLPTFLPPGTRPFNSTFYGHLRCRSSLFPALASSGEPLLLLLHGFFFFLFFFCLFVAWLLPFWLHAVAGGRQQQLAAQQPEEDDDFWWLSACVCAGRRIMTRVFFFFSTGRMVKPLRWSARHFSPGGQR